jgi:hypothetical protein
VENNQGFGNGMAQVGAGNKQLIVITQLWQQAAGMQNIDDLFLWLAQAFVQYFGVQVALFWTMHLNQAGHHTLKLRTNFCQDIRFPQQWLANNQVAIAAERLIQEQHGPLLLPVDHLFSSYQAALFKRYGLYYCSGHFLHSSTLLPPMHDDALATAHPLMMAVLLFLRQEPPARFLSGTGYVLGQALMVAKNRGFLLPASAVMRAMPGMPSTPRWQPIAPLPELIPRRLPDKNLMTARNPLAGSVAIPDKLARRVYGAIDGEKTVGDLAAMLRLSQEEVSAALGLLLTQQRVELCDSEGHILDSALFLNNR